MANRNESPAPGGRPSCGPLKTEAQARAYAAWSRGDLGLAEGNRLMLVAAVAVADVELGEYEDEVLRWLAGHLEPQMCAVVARLIAPDGAR